MITETETGSSLWACFMEPGKSYRLPDGTVETVASMEREPIRNARLFTFESGRKFYVRRDDVRKVRAA